MGRIRLKERDSQSRNEIGIKIVFIVYARTREYAGLGFLNIPVSASLIFMMENPKEKRKIIIG